MGEPEPNSLQQALTRLHEELAHARRLDADTRRMLRAALEEIGRSLGAAGAEAGAGHRLEALAVGFESDHPALAASLRQFIDLLGRAGV